MINDDAKPVRLVALDVFRGITIAGMILVNNPGTWSAIYAPLKHAEWHGVTPTDYIFPFFLFIVGVSIPLALGRLRQNEERNDEKAFDRRVYLKIFSRALMIFGLGIFLAAFPLFNLTASDLPVFAKIITMLALAAALFFWLVNKLKFALALAAVAVIVPLIFHFSGYTLAFIDFGTLRIPGVLQRIAICYAAAALIFLHTNWKRQAIVAAGLLIFYWILMTYLPVPGCETASVDDRACNLAAYLDRLILTENHIWKQAKVFDPEGILSTLPAIATTLSGVLTGVWLKSSRTELEKASGMFFFGVCLCALGYCWNLFFPYNKALWTSSYVVYTSGLALCFLAASFWLIDIKNYRRWARPFVIFGVNALALFVFSGLLGRMLSIIKIGGADGREVALQKWIFDTIFLPLAAPLNASLLYALCYIIFWFFLMRILYRRQIFIKV